MPQALPVYRRNMDDAPRRVAVMASDWPNGSHIPLHIHRRGQLLHAVKGIMRVETADALAEGTPLDDVLRLVEKVADQETVLCTHGDILKLLLEHVRGTGVKVRRRNGVPLMEKGSVWELATDHGTIVSATYHKPPLPTGR